MTNTPDNNPYQAPQSTTLTSKSKPPYWIGIVCVAAQLLNVRAASFLSLPMWATYLAAFAFGSVVFVAAVLVARRRGLLVAR